MESLPLELVSFINKCGHCFGSRSLKVFVTCSPVSLSGKPKGGQYVRVFLPPRITGRSGYPTSFVVTKSHIRPSWRSWLR
jgi:hypothetical protein